MENDGNERNKKLTVGEAASGTITGKSKLPEGGVESTGLFQPGEESPFAREYFHLLKKQGK